MAGRKRGWSREQVQRRRLFKSALAYFDLTLDAWAKRNKVSPNYSRNVLFGEASEAYTALIDQTIEDFQKAVVREYRPEPTVAI